MVYIVRTKLQADSAAAASLFVAARGWSCNTVHKVKLIQGGSLDGRDRVQPSRIAHADAGARGETMERASGGRQEEQIAEPFRRPVHQLRRSRQGERCSLR